MSDPASPTEPSGSADRAGHPVRPIAVAVAARPHPAEVVNGDAAAIDWVGEVCRIAVIDGLGHGVEAAAAADAAVRALKAHPAHAPIEALRLCHAALAGTRGAAISIARLDAGRRELVYAGIGNVEAHLWHEDRHERPICYRGIVGVVIPTVRAFTFALDGAWTLILHTDGVRARFDRDALARSAGCPAAGPAGAGVSPSGPSPLAGAILRTHARAADDATVVVAMPHGTSPHSPRAAARLDPGPPAPARGRGED